MKKCVRKCPSLGHEPPASDFRPPNAPSTKLCYNTDDSGRKIVAAKFIHVTAKAGTIFFSIFREKNEKHTIGHMSAAQKK